MTSKRILIFIEGRTVPASRFRVLQFLPCFTGHSVTVLATHPDKYLWYPAVIRRLRVLKGVWAAICLSWVVLQRLVQILRYVPRADVIVLQRELLYRVRAPFLESLMFSVARPSTRIVFDVDDAVFLGSNGQASASQERKLERICRHCDIVITGNSFLRTYFDRFSHATIVPTCVDTHAFRPGMGREQSSEIVIGWTGVRTNLRYLEPLLPVLRNLAREHRFLFKIITDEGAVLPFDATGVPLEVVPWREAAELHDLQTFDIGIMPLPDTDWARGKCGFKLLQYMAIQIPSVASPVGVNCEIVTPSVNGFLAESSEDWDRILRSLLTDPALRESIGRAGRATVVERYSVERWKRILVDRIVAGGALR